MTEVVSECLVRLCDPEYTMDALGTGPYDTSTAEDDPWIQFLSRQKIMEKGSEEKRRGVTSGLSKAQRLVLRSLESLNRESNGQRRNGVAMGGME